LFGYIQGDAIKLLEKESNCNRVQACQTYLDAFFKENPKAFVKFEKWREKQ